MTVLEQEEDTAVEPTGTVLADAMPLPDPVRNAQGRSYATGRRKDAVARVPARSRPRR